MYFIIIKEKYLRYQANFRTIRARIAAALAVFIKTHINHIFFKSLIIPDYELELTKTIYEIGTLCVKTHVSIHSYILNSKWAAFQSIWPE